MTDDAREQPSPLVTLAGLAPDAAFAAARMFQRAAFGAINRGARLTGTVAGAVAATAPVRGSLALLESQVRPLAERGAAQRQEDEAQFKAFLVGIEPLISAVVDLVVDLLPIDAILAKVDVNALIQRVDIDALVQRVDLARIVTDVLEGIELGDLIADSTTNIATSARDTARIQAIRGDGGIAGLVDRILRRRSARDLIVAGYPLANT
jgi:hypothetical protein